MKIVFTGGGTAGHVMVNKILIPFLQKKDEDCSILYIGSKEGMERDMISQLPAVKFFGISTGKLRRYFSLKNVSDLFRVFKGFWEALKILKKERPQLVYSGGGYVIVPVVWAARLLRIPVLLRETDRTVGLANRLCMPFAKEIYVTFPDTKKQITKIPSLFPGMLVRPELYEEHFRIEAGISNSKPVCLMMGGSQGAMKINTTIWSGISKLTETYNVIHLCGKGNCNREVLASEGYQQLEFTDQIGTYLSLAAVVVTRCGSNAITECLSLGKAAICIPITSHSSRGEQERNAKFAVEHGNAILLPEAELTVETLMDSIEVILQQKRSMPFKVTKNKVISDIQRHVDHIWSIAYEQLEYDMIVQAKGGKRMNPCDLSGYEVMLFCDVAENYG